MLFVSGLLHLAILVVSGGSWYGPLSLRKPATFGLSFGLTLVTIVWVTSFLSIRSRARALLLGAFTAACAIETALVTIQAWRGVPSHFNLETTFDGVVARTLAVGGFVLVVTILTFALVSLRPNPPVPISLRLAIRIGFLSLLGAVVVGAVMIARGMILVFAGSPQAAYATAGAMKPIHGVTMHAILVLPGLAWVLTFADWSERRRIAAVLAAAAGYAAITGAIALEVGLGQTTTATNVLFVIGVALFLATGVWAAIAVRRSHHA
jgi:hypothetical protein